MGIITTSQFSTGIVIKYETAMCEVLEFQLVKMQQRQPIVRTKLRNIRNGSVHEIAFRSGDKFEEVYLESRPIQYLYHEGSNYHFMDSQTYHEVIVSADLLGERANYLKDNSEATGRFDEEELVLVELPSSVELMVLETDPGMRGDTAKSGSKPAKVETGATIKVPLFVNPGDRIRVDTRTGEYLERV
jgi:elongation factor P